MIAPIPEVSALYLVTGTAAGDWTEHTVASCLTVADFEEYDRGRLGPLAAARVRDHLASCDPCRAAFEQFRGDRPVRPDASTLGGGAPAPDPPTIASVASPVSQASQKQPRIEGYEIKSVLGQGGMGIVYRAVQTKLNRAVALKVLPAMVGSANPAAVQRFRREAMAAARLHHTNIIPIYDFGESPDAYFYAMELITGEPLDELIGRLGEQSDPKASAGQLTRLLRDLHVPTSPQLARDDGSYSGSQDGGSGSPSVARTRTYFQHVARWMCDAADALNYAHGEGIIHRDIKPANLILSTEGRIMMADFGLAKSAEDRSVTMTGSLLGTLRYLSPEQAMAKRVHVDHRTDIYSLGATMYELLCFKPAFAATDEKEILGAIITRDPRAPSKTNRHVPFELETICLKCMEKSPDSRYATARALADDLRRYIDDLPIVAKRPGPVRRVVKFVKRRKAPVIAVTAAVALLASTLFWQRETVRRQRAQIASYHDSATAYVLTNRWAEAEDDLRAALRIDPDHIQTLLTLVWLKLEHFRKQPEQATLQSMEEAAEICKHVLRLDPSNTRALGDLGIALRRLERYPEAIEALKRALDLDPSPYHTWSNLGVLYTVTKDLEKAEEFLREGAERGGIVEDQWHAAVWRNLAALELFLKKPEVVEDIANAIHCDKGDVQSWVMRARLGLELDNHINLEEALDDAKHADRNGEFKNARAKRIRALAHLLNEEPENAIEHAGLAMELHDEPTVNYLIAAVAEAKLGHA
ncbi:MAG: protein kinase, partial [Phycisphaerales bacterium]